MIMTIKGEAFCLTKDAATALGRSIYTIQKWCRQGRFQNCRKYGRDFFIPVSAVDNMRSLLEDSGRLRKVGV